MYMYTCSVHTVSADHGIQHGVLNVGPSSASCAHTQVYALVIPTVVDTAVPHVVCQCLEILQRVREREREGGREREREGGREGERGGGGGGGGREKEGVGRERQYLYGMRACICVCV